MHISFCINLKFMWIQFFCLFRLFSFFFLFQFHIVFMLKAFFHVQWNKITCILLTGNLISLLFVFFLCYFFFLKSKNFLCMRTNKILIVRLNWMSLSLKHNVWEKILYIKQKISIKFWQNFILRFSFIDFFKLSIFSCLFLS